MVAESLVSGTAVVLVVAGGFLPSGFLILPPVVVALAVAGDVVVWRRLRTPLRLDRYSVVLAAAALAMLIAIGFGELLRSDAVLAVPGDAHNVVECAPSVNIPDEGNQVNRSIAGATTVMTIGSKIYIEDAPAPRALHLEGANVVCAGGGSGFGEMLIGTNPGAATLYVDTAAGPTYRIQVQVNP